ncbi:hypothetical protein BsWGS_25520 [Bradybaena similaris]
MCSLQSALRLGTRSWTRMMPSFRNSSDASHTVFSTGMPGCVISCSRNYSKIYNLQAGVAPQNTVLCEADAPRASPDVADTDRPQSVSSPNEASAHAQVTSSKTFQRTWQYLLTDWSRQVKQLQNDKLPVNLDNIVSKKLSTMVDLVLMPLTPPEWRHACLVLLLSQETDLELTCKLLNHTVVDAPHLPLKVIVDIIQTLTISYQTPLRVDIRKKLLTAVINERYYEITAKHIVMLMYQMDELFDMKHICKKQHQKDGHRKPTVQTLEKIKNMDPGKHDSTVIGNDWSANDHMQPKALGGSDDVPYIMSLNLEHRATNVVSDFKTKDLARIMMLLAKWRNRNETLINAVVHRLSQADFSDFHFVQLSNLLFSFSVLNIYNHQLLRQIVLHLAQATPTSPSLVCTVLASLSHLRWNDEALVSGCLSFLADHMSELTGKDARSVLMSLANLYIVPKTEAQNNLVKELAKRAFTGDVTPVSKVNCAWCLAILLSLGAELGQSLLQPEFISQFSGDNDAHNLACFHKLCSIWTALQYEVRGYSKPGLLLPEVLVTSARHDGAGSVLRAQLNNCLKMFVDVTSYVSLGHALKDGLVADAVICADITGELRPLDVVADEKVFKLAIQLVPFSGVLNVTGSPCGSYSMAARHWKHLGYVPVQILHSDLKPSLSALEKVNNIKAKIQSAVMEFVTERQSLTS